MLVTLRSEQTFPPGTSVGAYPASSQLSENLGRTPRGTPSDTQTVGSDGSLIFPDLDGGEYFAVAQVSGQWRYLRFPVPETQEQTQDQAVLDLEDAVAALAAQVAGVSSGLDQPTVQAMIDQGIATNNFQRDPIVNAKADRTELDAVDLTIASHEGLAAGRSIVHGFPITFSDGQTMIWDEVNRRFVPHDLGTPGTPPSTAFDNFDLFDAPAVPASAPIFADNNLGDGVARTGDTVIVAAQPGLSIKVVHVSLIAGGVANLVWKSGSNILPNSHFLAGNNGIVDDSRNKLPAMPTGVGEALILNTTVLPPINTLGGTAASWVAGHLSYYLE